MVRRSNNYSLPALYLTMENPEIQFIRLPSKNPKKPVLLVAFWEGLVLIFDEHFGTLTLKAKKIEAAISRVTVIIFGIVGFGGMVLFIVSSYIKNPPTLDSFILNFLITGLSEPSLERSLFFLTLLTDLYLIAELMRSGERRHEVRHLAHDSEKKAVMPPALQNADDLKQISKIYRIEVDLTLNEKSEKILLESYFLAQRFSQSAVTPLHLLMSAVGYDGQVQNVIGRLGLPMEDLVGKLVRKTTTPETAPAEPYLTDGSYSVLLKSYVAAAHEHVEYIEPLEIFLESFLASPEAQEVFYDFGVTKEDVGNAVAWQRINRRLYERYLRYKSAGKLRSKSGIDRAMTSMATPFVNRISDDLTSLAQRGYLELHVGREAEYDAMYRLFESGNKNVVIIGEAGVGKSAFVEGLAEKIIGDDVPVILREKRLISISISKLLSGASASQANDRLFTAYKEVVSAGNTIVYIDNIHDIYGIGVSDQGLDMSAVLAELLARNQIYSIVATTPQAYRATVENSALGNVLRPLTLEEMSTQDSILALETKTGFVEQKSGVNFSYQSLKSLVEFADRYIHDQNFPQKAIVLMEEAGAYVRNKKGQGALVTREDIAQLLTEKLHIPIAEITTGESEKLLRLEEILHQRIIGQEEAVTAVATALRRARAELRDINRPIASMLFLGPTGVGKTELAKAIAEAYFGSEDNMIRLDMSEFQNQADLYKMIGSPPGTGGTQRGLLTEAVRKNPFAIVLLDELEKAHPDILNVFLQVMEDGRLTDAQGSTADFTNAIIIATSNAATPFVQQQISAGIPLDQIKQQLLGGELMKFFRPEFINRFDGVVLFRPLTIDDVQQVARLMVGKVIKAMEKKGITLRVSEDALAELAQKGFDPQYGARPLRRVIQDQVDNALAQFLIAGKLGRRDIVILEPGGKITIQKAEAL